MSVYEDQASELLSKYIEELKRVEGTDAVNFIARTPIDPADMAYLLPLTEDLHQFLQLEPKVVNGRAAARAHLLDAIRSDRPHVPLPATASQRGRRRFLPTGVRQIGLSFALLLITVLAAIALYSTWRSVNPPSCPLLPAAPVKAVKAVAAAAPKAAIVAKQQKCD